MTRPIRLPPWSRPGVLRLGQAVVFAAFFNLIAIFIFHLSVAATVGKGIADPGVIDVHVVFGALVGAISWNLVTWYYGIPSSSSHALIGGIVGAVMAKSGSGGLVASGIWKTVAFIFVSPLLGFFLGSMMMVVVAWVFRKSTPSRVDRWFRRLQLVSAGAYSLGHGGNDAQKTIGIIWMLLIATGYSSASDANPPTWTIVCCYTAIALGTMFGGWRIVKTMGQKITKLKPVGGFCAETGGAITLFLATALEHPGVNHAHHHRRDRWRRIGAARERGAMGRGGQHRLGLDLHDPRVGVRGVRLRVLGQLAVVLTLDLPWPAAARATVQRANKSR